MCIRNPALRGLGCGGVSVDWRRGAVSRGAREEWIFDKDDVFEGGEGAIVFDLKIEVELGVWSIGYGSRISAF